MVPRELKADSNFDAKSIFIRLKTRPVSPRHASLKDFLGMSDPDSLESRQQARHPQKSSLHASESAAKPQTP